MVYFPGRRGGEFFINFSPVTDGEILMTRALQST
jgi:hypothetical protein